MNFPAGLKNFIGNPGVVDILNHAIGKDRLPHAMIFAGPEGVGKCTLALLIAQRLNCLSPAGDNACGTCLACKKIRKVAESRYLDCLTLKEGFCGTCQNCKTRTGRHPDVRLVEPEKSTIAIRQVRELINEIAFQPAEARYRVVILDPAEQMRPEAHNSLLKTLEEPASRTVIILVTTNPYLLLETIRSRSRMLHFAEIPQDRIEWHLIEMEGKKPGEARLAAALSGGSLAAALSFSAKDYRQIREQALEFVALLSKPGRFAEVSNAAAQVAKDKEFFQLWIGSVAALLQDIYYAGPAKERVGQRDILDRIEEIGKHLPRSRIVAMIQAVQKLNRDLQFNVNRQIALEAMFISLSCTP